jgi:GT2 family glycosyltransferase
MKTLAIIITCFNRADTTEKSIHAIYKSDIPKDLSFEIYLTDDGSTDDTSNRISQKFPTVNIIKGNGHLYWNGGMRLAFGKAIEKNFDMYLWLNDDTILFQDTIKLLMSTANRNKESAIIVGSTKSSIDGNVTYGGKIRTSFWHPFKYELVTPTNTSTSCDTMNGNCVLIPNKIINSIGNLDSNFIHTIGDIDYGLRAKKAGFDIIVMPGYAGICDKNIINNTFFDKNLNLRQRFLHLSGKKGLPFKSWYIFARRHGGLLWIYFWLSVYFKLLAQNRNT